MIEAAGAMGWTEQQFWLSTPMYFYHAYKGFLRQKIHDQRHDYELARFGSFLQCGQEGQTVYDLITFPWEKNTKEPTKWPEISMDEIRQFEDEADIIFQKMLADGWQER